MAYRACVIDRAYILRWTGEPVLADVSSILQAVTAARRGAGEPILYLGIIAADIPMPKGAVRDAFTNSFPAMSELCACFDVLIEDRDIRATLIRTLVRAMALAVPGRKMHVFGSEVQVAREWRKLYGVDALSILQRFKAFEQTKVA
jgi:hypothetical protein